MKAKRTLRIARWETARSFGSVDRKTAVILLAIVLLLAALAPALVAVNPTPGADLYRVGVSDSHPYHDVVSQDRRLQAVDPRTSSLEEGTIDVLVTQSRVVVTETEKSQAAAGVLRESIVAYNDRLMARETDQAAAFPVTVTLSYAEQTNLVDYTGDTGQQSADGETDDSGSELGTTTDTAALQTTKTSPSGDQQTPTPTDGATDSSRTSSQESISGTETAGDSKETDTPGATTVSGGYSGRNTDDGPLSGLFGSGQAGTPSGITPPFPLESLLLAFAFLLPFNFVIQAYGSSVIAERINRRGEPLLVAPVSRGDIIIGKALPYFVGSLGITAGIAFVLGGSVRSIVAIAPIAALFIAATFVAGMLSRSYKELTFSTVTISVVLTGYAFLPAVFAEVHPIAAISPLTIVVNDLQGASVGVGTFVLGTLPATLSAGVLLALGAGLYREEDLFTRRPLPAKALDALAAPLRSRFRVGLWTALFIPFVLVAELMAVAALFVLPVSLSIPLLLAVLAIVEEVAKSLHIYAGYRRGRFKTDRSNAIVLGISSGVGFFLAEKILGITQLVGLPNLDIGRAAFGPDILGLSTIGLLFAPLLLHSVTAAISALGARESRNRYFIGLIFAALIHLAYNLVVVSSLG